MGRRPCCSKEGLNRGAWTAMEDKILRDYIRIHGEGKWRNLPKMAGLKRCGKSCRLRWLNYLRPDIKRGSITNDEEDLIIRLHNLLGNRWSLIAGRLPGRTDNEIKNYWNTTLIKKVHGQLITSPASKLKTSLDQSKQKKNSPPSCVVRPKASRCTKVLITPEPENTRQLDTKSVFEQNTNAAAVPPEPYGGASPYDLFPTDFEMDDKFLSDFLNAEFAPLCEFIDGLEGDNNTNKSADYSSDIIGSMTSIIDPENWFRHQQKVPEENGKNN